MQKYNCYEKGSDNYVCTLYGMTDVLNLRRFFAEKGIDLYAKPAEISKRTARNIFSKNDIAQVLTKN